MATPRSVRRVMSRRVVKCAAADCKFGKGVSAHAARQHADATGHAVTETRSYRIERRDPNLTPGRTVKPS